MQADSKNYHINLQITQIHSLNQPKDFINTIKYDNTNNRIILIHELNTLEIITNTETPKQTILTFQSNIYDVAVVNSSLVVSNKGMPLRIYEVNENSVEPTVALYDRKQNSQTFLTPLQFAQNADRLVGGGKKFVSEYDLNKISCHRFKSMDKKFVSSVQFLSESMLLTGHFTGEIEFLDIQSGRIVTSIKPHVDLVTKIKAIQKQHYFISLARKDNYCYIWDDRNMSTFVNFYEHPRYGNQRTGLELTHDHKYLLLGGQKGELFIHGLRQSLRQDYSLNLGHQKCVSSVCCTSQDIICAIGERQFSQPFSAGYICCAKMIQQITEQC